MTHARLAPKKHHFGYGIFLFALDLDELALIERSVGLFSLERRNLYTFHDSDYLPTHGGGDQSASSALKSRVVAFTESHGVHMNGGRIVLVTLPRVVGYLFNPVSFYFCYHRSGSPVAAVAEVTNTFREVKPYFIPVVKDAASGSRFRLRVPKYFYVSPFSDVDVEFDFDLRCPGESLTVRIDDLTAGQRTFVSTLVGSRRPLTTGQLAWLTVRYPLISVRTIGLIHWHALRLWLKRVRWYAKAARPADQRQVLRPHASLARSASSAGPTHELVPANVRSHQLT